MDEIEVLGQISLRIGAAIHKMDYVAWQGRCWLVPLWLVSPDQKTESPVRLIAPRMAAGYTAPAGPGLLEMFTKLSLPMSTYEQGFIPDAMKNLVEIVENPPVFARH